MTDFKFCSKPEDVPWWIRRSAKRIIENITCIYFHKAMLCTIRYGAGHGILYAEGQVLTAGVLDAHFGSVAPWRQKSNEQSIGR